MVLRKLRRLEAMDDEVGLLGEVDSVLMEDRVGKRTPRPACKGSEKTRIPESPRAWHHFFNTSAIFQRQQPQNDDAIEILPRIIGLAELGKLLDHLPDDRP